MEKLIGGTILIVVGAVIGVVLAFNVMVRWIQIGTQSNPDALSGIVIND